MDGWMDGWMDILQVGCGVDGVENLLANGSL